MTVDTAVNTVHNRLHEDFWHWDVNHDDLTDINRAVNELSPPERNELISRLSDDDLKRWTEEIDGMNGSLTVDERQDLFNKLAEGLDGAQLAKLAKAFDGSPDGREALGQAVAEKFSPEAKAAFIEANMDSIDSQYNSVTGRYGNAETVVMADVLSSLSSDQANFDKAIKSLAAHNPKALKDIMAVGLGRANIADPTGSTAGADVFNPSATLGIINAAASSKDPQVKALVFKAATAQYKDVEGLTAENSYWNATTNSYRDAITKLVQSDPNGLVTELRTRTDITGNSLSVYAKEMLKETMKEMLKPGMTEDQRNQLSRDLRNLLIQMQQGNDKQGNAYNNFSDPAYARNLGFFAGAINAGLNSIADDAETQGKLLDTIFGTGFGAAGASIGNAITSKIIDDNVDDVKKNAKDLKSAMYDLAIPRNSENETNQAGTGYDAFNAAFAAIAELQR